MGYPPLRLVRPWFYSFLCSAWHLQPALCPGQRLSNLLHSLPQAISTPFFSASPDTPSSRKPSLTKSSSCSTELCPSIFGSICLCFCVRHFLPPLHHQALEFPKYRDYFPSSCFSSGLNRPEEAGGEVMLPTFSTQSLPWALDPRAS